MSSLMVGTIGIVNTAAMLLLAICTASKIGASIVKGQMDKGKAKTIVAKEFIKLASIVSILFILVNFISLRLGILSFGLIVNMVAIMLTVMIAGMISGMLGGIAGIFMWGILEKKMSISISDSKEDAPYDGMTVGIQLGLLIGVIVGLVILFNTEMGVREFLMIRESMLEWIYQYLNK